MKELPSGYWVAKAFRSNGKDHCLGQCSMVDRHAYNYLTFRFNIDYSLSQ
jgi:hypothetical protein